jgi:hypothetical protein
VRAGQSVGAAATVAEGSQQPILWDDAAGPNTPMPYVVFVMSDGQRLNASSPGKTNEYNEEWSIPITFSVHALDKATAAYFAKRIALKFDRASLSFSSVDRHVTTERESDTFTREGDTEYVFELNYVVRVDRLFG